MISTQLYRLGFYFNNYKSYSVKKLGELFYIKLGRTIKSVLYNFTKGVNYCIDCIKKCIVVFWRLLFKIYKLHSILG